MKGLWVKDFIVLKRQVLAVFITFVLAVFSLAFFGQNGIVIGMAIFSVTLSFIILNSLTLDQQNHGLMYLFTMPFKKKQYVVQKYLLLLFAAIGSVVLMTIITGVFSGIADWNLGFSNIFTRIYGVGVAGLIVLIFITQYQIKYGPEKVQVAMSMIGAIVVVVAGGIVALIKYTAFGNNIFNQIFTYYTRYGSLPFLLLFTIVGIVVVSLSCAKSIKTLEYMELQ